MATIGERGIGSFGARICAAFTTAHETNIQILVVGRSEFALRAEYPGAGFFAGQTV
jgi:hypothetical protein